MRIKPLLYVLVGGTFAPLIALVDWTCCPQIPFRQCLTDVYQDLQEEIKTHWQ